MSFQQGDLVRTKYGNAFTNGAFLSRVRGYLGRQGGFDWIELEQSYVRADIIEKVSHGDQ